MPLVVILMAPSRSPVAANFGANMRNS